MALNEMEALAVIYKSIQFKNLYLSPLSYPLSPWETNMDRPKLPV